MPAHLYFYGYDTWHRQGFTNPILDRFLINLDRTLHLFSYPTISKPIALLRLAMYTFGNKLKKTLAITWQRVLVGLVVGLLLLLVNTALMHCHDWYPTSEPTPTH